MYDTNSALRRTSTQSVQLVEDEVLQRGTDKEVCEAAAEKVILLARRTDMHNWLFIFCFSLYNGVNFENIKNTVYIAYTVLSCFFNLYIKI